VRLTGARRPTTALAASLTAKGQAWTLLPAGGPAAAPAVLPAAAPAVLPAAAPAWLPV